VLFAGGADGDLDVLAEGGEEFQEAADAEVAGAVAHLEGRIVANFQGKRLREISLCASRPFHRK
jgi:hypothetical protein